MRAATGVVASPAHLSSVKASKNGEESTAIRQHQCAAAPAVNDVDIFVVRFDTPVSRSSLLRTASLERFSKRLLSLLRVTFSVRHG